MAVPKAILQRTNRLGCYVFSLEERCRKKSRHVTITGQKQWPEGQGEEVMRGGEGREVWIRS